jgi:hypothetical protein
VINNHITLLEWVTPAIHDLGRTVRGRASETRAGSFNLAFSARIQIKPLTSRTTRTNNKHPVRVVRGYKFESQPPYAPRIPARESAQLRVFFKEHGKTARVPPVKEIA